MWDTQISLGRGNIRDFVIGLGAGGGGNMSSQVGVTWRGRVLMGTAVGVLQGHVESCHRGISQEDASLDS